MARTLRLMSERKLRASMPTEAATIRALYSAWERLKHFGWNDIMYCPKDGSHFQVIELGSMGIFDCCYSGKWPDGHWLVFDEHDCYPTSAGPLMYRLYPEDEAKRKAKMDKAFLALLAEG